MELVEMQLSEMQFENINEVGKMQLSEMQLENVNEAGKMQLSEIQFENVDRQKLTVIELTTRYMLIGQELDTLFDVISALGDGSNKTITYLYEGYYSAPDSDEYKIPQNEFSYFLLIDKNNKTMDLTNKFNEAINFMQLTNTQISFLYSYVSELQNKEENIRNELNSNGIPTFDCYFRKIASLKTHFHDFIQFNHIPLKIT